MKSQSKIPSQAVQVGSQKIRYSAIENDFQLQFPLRFELRNRKVGALVLTRGKANDQLRFVFGFECQGIHSTLRKNQRSNAFDAIESGLKDLPRNESMTIHMSSFSSDKDRQVQLNTMLSKCEIPRLEYLLKSEKQRVNDLTQQGIRKPKSLYIYVTYTVDAATVHAADKLEKLIGLTHQLWNKFTGQQEEVERLHLESVFTKAFTDGFQLWEQILSTKMGLSIKPMTEKDLWTQTWKRFNRNAAPPLPQEVVMSESGIKETIHSTIHPTTLLIQKDCPVADRSWVKVNGRYVAALSFIEKPAGWASKYAQLRYLWDVLSKDQVYDTEIFCDLSRGDEAVIKTDMQRLTKQAIVSADNATSKQSADVVAEIKKRKSLAAQEKLYEGAVPMRIASVMFIHHTPLRQHNGSIEPPKTTLSRLNEACRYLESCFRQPAWVEREKEYAWMLWTQSLPISWNPLLSHPFPSRRLCYLSGEAPGFMALVRPKEGDKSGFELLSEEGGVPLFIDFFKRHRNLAIFGTTRSGKSVLVSGVLTLALAQGIPIVALDFPATDSASTFKDYAAFVGDKAAYFDISSAHNNLFEVPDLRNLPLQDQGIRMKEFKGFLLNALMTMVVGNDKSDIGRRTNVKTLNALWLEGFFNDPQIKLRYDMALAAGLGTDAWLNIPTLKDFEQFCDLSRLDIGDISDDIREAATLIKMRLKYWITSPVGQAISEPTSFKSDAQLLIFALRGLGDDEDAAVLTLAAYSASMRRAMSCPISIFFMDEASILFEFSELSALVGRQCANGAKAGVRVIISAQDPDTIARSPSAAKILQNLNTRLVGRIQPTAVASFVKYLEYPVEIIEHNSSDSFFPKAASIYSQWLLDDNGTYTYCRYYPGYLQLAAVANNPHEQMVRDSYLRRYPSDPYRALSEFAEALVAHLKDGGELKAVAPLKQSVSKSPQSLVQDVPLPALAAAGSAQ